MTSQSIESENYWQKALDSLDAELRNSLDVTRIAKRDILAGVLRAAEEKRQLCLRKRWRLKAPSGKYVIVRDVLEKIVKWIDRFKAVGGTGVQFDPVHAALPWAGVRFLLTVTVHDLHIFGLMVQNLETVSRIIAQYSDFERLYLQLPSSGIDLLKAALTRLYAKILTFLANAVKYFHRGSATRFLKSVFQPTQDNFIHDVKAKEEEVLNLARLADAEKLNFLRSTVTRFADRAQIFDKSLLESQHLELLRWVSLIPFTRHHELHSSNRLSGSGDWLLEHRQFQAWKSSSSSSILLLHGIPGCGKTVLCSKVIDWFLSESPDSTHLAPLAYFYCTDFESEPERSSPDAIMRSILRQLTISPKPRRRAHEALVSEFERRQAAAKVDGFEVTKLQLAECVDLILEVAKNNPLNIIIDAVDEVTEQTRHNLLKALVQIVNMSSNVVKIFVTSRNNSNIFAVLEVAEKICIHAQDNKSDVEQFTRYQVGKAVQDCRLLNGAVTYQVQTNLVQSLQKGSGEMFLWVKLQVDRLCRIKHEQDLLLPIRETSLEALDTIYSKSMDQILEVGKNASEIARRAFSWLLFMKEPLTSETFISAIFTTSLAEQVPIDVHGLEDICHNMILFDSKLNIMRFAHQSVLDFVRTYPEFDPIVAQRRLATACLDLCLKGLVPTIGAAFTPTEQINHYATLYWPDHYKSADIGNPDETLFVELTELVFENSGDTSLSFIAWMESLRLCSSLISIDHAKKKTVEAIISADYSPLFMACWYGFPRLLNQLNDLKGFDWDQKNSLGHTGLYLASVNGQTNIVQYLIQRGARINVQCGRLGSPLYAACFTGHISIVQLLLDHHADARLGTTFENAVEAAFRGDHEDVAMAVLQNEFNFLNEKESDQMLLGALRVGFVKVVEYLHKIPKGSPAGIPTPEKGRAMANKAIASGRKDLLQYLLRREDFSRDILPADAVSSAALYGRQAMVEFLLECGLDIEEEGLFGSPLRSASLMDHESVVQTLLDRAVNINACGKLGTALQAATMKGHLRITKLLIEEHANVNLHGGFYGTALQAASYHGHKDVVMILLEAGAQIGARGLFKDAFYSAAEGGHHEIIQIFLREGYNLHQFHCAIPHTVSHVVGLAGSAVIYPFSQDQPFKQFLESTCHDKSHRDTPQDFFQDSHCHIGNTSLDTHPLGYDQIYESISKGEWRQGSFSILPYQKSTSSREENYALEAAASAGKITVVQFFLKKRKEFGIECEELGMAFQNAAGNGHSAVVQLFLHSNIDLKQYFQKSMEAAALNGHEHILINIWDYATTYEPTKLSLSEIIQSACRGQVSTIKLLLGLIHKRYPQTELRSTLQVSLVEAARRGALKIIEYFLHDGLQPDPESMTSAFEAACMSGQISVVKTLLDYDSNQAIRLEVKDKALQKALIFGYAEVLGLLLCYIDEDRILQLAREHVTHAAGNGHAQVTEILVESLKHLEEFQYILIRALTIAAENGHEEVVSILIHRITDVNISVERVKPAIFWHNGENYMGSPTINALQACLRGFSKNRCRRPALPSWKTGTRDTAWEAIIQILVDNGFDLKATESQTYSPLHEAAQYSSEKIVGYLIEAGADPNIPLGDKSILELTAERELSANAVLQLLLQAGAIIPKSGASENPIINKALTFFSETSSTGLMTTYHPHGRLLLSDSIQYVLNDGPGAVIQTMLSQLPGERATDKRYGLLLQMAAKVGNRPCVELLIDRGFDVNSVGYYYGTALQAACRYGHIDLVRLLLQAGADVNILKGRHQTALRAAIVGGHEDIFDVLIIHGADISLGFQTQPDHGADMSLGFWTQPDWRNDISPESRNILHFAVTRGFNEIAKRLLLASADLLLDQLDHEKMLINVCKGGNIEMVDIFLSAGANMDALDKSEPHSIRDISLLHLVCEKKLENIVRYLETRGVEFKDIEPWITLMEVTTKERILSKANLLLAAGATLDRNLCDTALLTASHEGQYDIVKELLSLRPSQFGLSSIKTALARACERLHSSIFELLLESISQIENPSQICIELMKKIVNLEESDRPNSLSVLSPVSTDNRGKAKLFECLFEYLPFSTDTLIAACCVGSTRSVEIILDQGVAVDGMDTQGLSPLDAAACSLQPNVVRFLLCRGANTRHRSKLRSLGRLGRMRSSILEK